MKIPYSIARELHKRVLARLEAEGLKRRRHTKSSLGGYVAAFRGPPIQGKHPVVAVGIKPEEAQLAADLGEFDDLVGARCQNALVTYRDMVKQGPPQEYKHQAYGVRPDGTIGTMTQEQYDEIMNRGTGQSGMPGGLDTLVGRKP